MESNNLHNLFHSGSCIPESELEQYAKGQTIGLDANQIERHLVDCDACSDTVEGLEMFYEAEKNKIIPISHSKGEQNTDDKIVSINPPKEKNYRKIFAYAASVLVLATLGALSLKFLGDLKDKKNDVAILEKPVDEDIVMDTLDPLADKSLQDQDNDENQVETVQQDGDGYDVGVGSTKKADLDATLNGSLADKVDLSSEKTPIEEADDNSFKGYITAEVADLKNEELSKTGAAQSNESTIESLEESAPVFNDTPVAYKSELSKDQKKSRSLKNKLKERAQEEESRTKEDQISFGFSGSGVEDREIAEEEKAKNNWASEPYLDSDPGDDIVLDSISSFDFYTNEGRLHLGEFSSEGQKHLVNGLLQGVEGSGAVFFMDKSLVKGYLEEESTGRKFDVDLDFSNANRKSVSGEISLNEKAIIPIFLSFDSKKINLDTNKTYNLFINFDDGILTYPNGKSLLLPGPKPIKMGLK
ncbi:MAG: hypothetical protein MRY83_00645 [Flavobacteriales bacterium]|nr:hypothetical protein [Flavobacteriales bacterium]